jgi:hypothetical protein
LVQTERLNKRQAKKTATSQEMKKKKNWFKEFPRVGKLNIWNDADDFVGLVLENNAFPGRPVGVSFRKLSQLNVDVVLSYGFLEKYAAQI